MTATVSAAGAGTAPGPERTKAKRRAGGGLGRYLIIRALLIIPTIFILVTVVFFLMRSTGDPITASLGGKLPPAQLHERIAQAGFDRPLFVQYVEYLGQLLRGDFGTTFSDHQAVTQVLIHYGAATLELAFYALIVAFVVGIPLGMVAGYFRDKGQDATSPISRSLSYAPPASFPALGLNWSSPI